ncbi:MAG: hypothetical protein ACXVXJ_04725 [Mycobacteriaceae bacterium]
MTPPSQIATNAAAIRAVADRLEREGHPDAHGLAEEIAALLTLSGYRPIEPPPRPSGPGSTEAGRAAAKALFDELRTPKESY